MEKLSQKRRRSRGVILLSMAAFGLTACGPNYSGEGNDFRVDGRVTTAGHRSLTVDVYNIKKEEGEANGWFEDGVSHQIHDNCNCSSDFWTSNEKVGHVLNLQGEEVEPFQVPLGTCVEFEGKIRANQEGKYHHDRPVYELAQEIPC